MPVQSPSAPELNIYQSKAGSAFLAAFCFALLTVFDIASQTIFHPAPSLDFLLVLCLHIVPAIWLIRRLIASHLRLSINKSGVWMAQSGLIPWTGIRYIYREIDPAGSATIHAVIVRMIEDSTRNGDRDYRINLDFYEISAENLMKVMRVYLKQYDIPDIGSGGEEREGIPPYQKDAR